VEEGEPHCPSSVHHLFRYMRDPMYIGPQRQTLGWLAPVPNNLPTQFNLPIRTARTC
jgi:hypothetical protein